MENTSYNTSIVVSASPAEAMKSISRIDLWWRKDFTGSAAKLNDTFTVSFGHPAFVGFTVSEYVPGSKAVWKVTDCHLPWFSDTKEWNNTEVVFALSEAGGKTRIHFTHLGLVPQVECYEVCEKGWNGHLASLRSLIDEGKAIA